MSKHVHRIQTPMIWAFNHVSTLSGPVRTACFSRFEPNRGVCCARGTIPGTTGANDKSMAWDITRKGMGATVALGATHVIPGYSTPNRAVAYNSQLFESGGVGIATSRNPWCQQLVSL